MEAVANTICGLWQAQDHETMNQKSHLGRLSAGSFRAWIPEEKTNRSVQNGTSKAESPCTSSRSFKTKSNILKSSRDALRKVLLYL